MNNENNKAESSVSELRMRLKSGEVSLTDVEKRYAEIDRRVSLF